MVSKANDLKFIMRTVAILTILLGEGQAQEKRSALSECRKATETLRIMASTFERGDDSRLLFALTHYGISSRLCDLVAEESFSDSRTVARMNARFVKLLPVNGENAPEHWRIALQKCRGNADAYACSQAMATAHIDYDMPRVVNSLPCLNEPDWDQILDRAIVPSLSEAIDYVRGRSGKWADPTKGFVKMYSAAWTKRLRDRAREAAHCD